MIVYQFSTISEWLAQNIYNRIVYLNEPDNFNDPTENNFSLRNMEECDGGVEFKKMFLRSIKEGLPESYKKKKAEDFITSNINNLYDFEKPKKDNILENNLFEDRFSDELMGVLNGEEMESFCHRTVTEVQRNFRISSFTRSQSNALMWGHYANGMRGVCVAYDIDEKDLNKVEYEECYDVDVLRVLAGGVEDEVRKTFLRKSVSWEYEQEYRIINPNEENYALKKGQVRRIYFGYKCDGEKADFIARLALDAHGDQVSFCITRNLVSSQYTVNIPVVVGELKDKLSEVRKKMKEGSTFEEDEVFKRICKAEFGKGDKY